MADMCIWWGLLDVVDGGGTAYPTMLAPGTDFGSGARASSETVQNLASSTHSSAAPDFGKGVTLAFVRPIGGALWIAVGENPAAVANAANAIYVPEGEILPIGLIPGQRIAGIDA